MGVEKKALQFKLQIQITQNKYEITFCRFTLFRMFSNTKILNLFRHWNFFHSMIFFFFSLSAAYHTLNCHSRVCTFCSYLMCHRAIILTFCFFFSQSQKAALQMNENIRWKKSVAWKCVNIWRSSKIHQIQEFVIFSRHTEGSFEHKS